MNSESSYKLQQLIIVILSLSSFIFYSVHAYKRYKAGLHSIAVFGMLITTTFLVIRSVDPVAINNIYGYEVVDFLSKMTTVSLLLTAYATVYCYADIVYNSFTSRLPLKYFWHFVCECTLSILSAVISSFVNGITTVHHLVLMATELIASVSFICIGYHMNASGYEKYGTTIDSSIRSFRSSTHRLIGLFGCLCGLQAYMIYIGPQEQPNAEEYKADDILFLYIHMAAVYSYVPFVIMNNTSNPVNISVFRVNTKTPTSEFKLSIDWVKSASNDTDTVASSDVFGENSV